MLARHGRQQLAPISAASERLSDPNKRHKTSPTPHDVPSDDAHAVSRGIERQSNPLDRIRGEQVIEYPTPCRVKSKAVHSVDMVLVQRPREHPREHRQQALVIGAPQPFEPKLNGNSVSQPAPTSNS